MTCLLMILTMVVPAFGASDKCPAVNSLGTKLVSAIVTYDYSGVTDSSTGNTTFTYTFKGLDPSNPSTNGIPGLITYCVYPQASNDPTGSIVASAIGADGTPFAAAESAKGSFSFTRGDGDPSNVPFDGIVDTMGTATWNGKCITDPIQLTTTCESTATDTQTADDPCCCPNPWPRMATAPGAFREGM
jgi:hypothetical protein